MLADARLIAGKDLRIELRSKVGIGQMVPFAVLVLVLFGLALDPDRGVLTRATPGLYWIAVLFSALLAVQRSFAVESAPGVAEALRLSGIDPAGYFLGKFAAVAAQLVVLQLVLVAGVVVLYGADLAGPLLLVATAVAATVAIASAGTLYGVLAAGLRVRDTLVPLLLLPALAPVLLGATRASEAALDGGIGDGWGWCGLLATFGVLYVGFGLLFFGTLLEET
ncbi:MAG: heme exporter protein CcmB [Acidimicrobiales bacterium]|nr:heme exporter protein CcmB [Acidimicrobiales bacterium]